MIVVKWREPIRERARVYNKSIAEQEGDKDLIRKNAAYTCGLIASADEICSIKCHSIDTHDRRGL